MKKLLFAIAILSVSFALKSCNSSSVSGDPKATLESFLEDLGKLDIENARKLATADSKSMFDMMEMGIKSGNAPKNVEKFDKTKIVFGDAVQSGDMVTIPVKKIDSGQSINFTLKKEAGAWKVVFDIGTMMQQAMEKMKDNKTLIDTLDKHFRKLNKMYADSLQGLMKNGTKSLDSLKSLVK